MAEIALLAMLLVIAVTSFVGSVRAYKDLMESLDG
jgi:hypothetical protein